MPKVTEYAINSDNLVIIMESLRTLLTEDDKRKLQNETTDFLLKKGSYSGTVIVSGKPLDDSDHLRQYYANIEDILVHSKNRDIIINHFKTAAKAALCVAAAAAICAISFGLLALAIGGAVAFGVAGIFAGAMLLGLFGGMGAVIGGGFASFGSSIAAWAGVEAIFKEGAKETEELEASYEKGNQAYNSIHKFFTTGRIPGVEAPVNSAVNDTSFETKFDNDTSDEDTRLNQ